MVLARSCPGTNLPHRRVPVFCIYGKFLANLCDLSASSSPERLYSEIGRLKMELDWLKKKSGISQ